MPDRFDGNESQNRIIAEQLFTVWTNEQTRTTRRWTGSMPAWIACVLSIGLLIWNAAVISGNVAQNTRRIDQIEAKVDIIIAEKKL